MVYVVKLFDLFMFMLDLVTSNTLVETFWFLLFLISIVHIVRSMLCTL